MKKRILTILVAIISCLTISVLVEIFGFNFHVLTLDDQAKSASTIPYDTENIGDQTVVKFNASNTFINKLVVNYEASENTEYALSYKYIGAYNKEFTENVPVDIFDETFNTSVTNIGKTVSDATIIYTAPGQLKINQISIDNTFHFNYFRTIFIFLVLMTAFSLFCFYKDGARTEKLHIYFAVICTLLGSMVIVAQPAATFYSWDDQIHFEETVDWFGGTIKYSNGEYNLSDADVLNSAGRSAVFSADEKQMQIEYLNSDIDHDFTKTKSSIPSFGKISYLPMAIGYNLAKFIHLPFIACFLIGKIFNLLFYVILVSYAIKTSKIGKKLLTVIAMIPTSIFLASSYSYDPAVFTGLTIFLIHTLNLFLDKTTKLDFKTILIMIASISYACLAKAIYAPIILLTLLIPKERFEQPKYSKIIKASFIGIMILLLTTAAFPAMSGSSLGDSRGGDTSFSEQASLVLSHPTDYITTLQNNAGELFSYKMIGSKTLESFSYMDTLNQNESNTFFVFLIFLIFIFLTDNRGNLLNKKQRGLGIFTILLIIFLIWSALYLSYTPVGSSSINGVQGRYFLPLLFPLLLFLQPKNIQNKINPKLYNTLVLAIPAIIMIILIYSIILVPYSL